MDLKLLMRGLGDRIVAWLLIVLGGLALLLGWWGVSGTPLPSEQIPYVASGGLVGISLIGIGATLLISADLRDEWRKLDRIEDALRGAGETSAPPTLDTATDGKEPTDGAEQDALRPTAPAAPVGR